MRKKIYTTLLCLSFSVLGVIMLYWYSSTINSRRNGFIRFFPPHYLSDIHQLNIRYNSWYIAGLSSSHIYLGNFTAQDQLLILNLALTDSQYTRVGIPDNYRINWKYASIIVDSPDIWLIDGGTPLLLHGNLKKDSMTDRYLMDSTWFDACLPLSAQSAIVKTYDRGKRRFILARKRYGSPELIRADDALTTQGDGQFSIDGMLSGSPHSGRLVYLYYYRNQFTCLDTNLNILFKGHTIDTTRITRIKVDSIPSQHRLMPASPLVQINKLSCLSEDKLYVNSGLMANNETPASFHRSSVMDIYDLHDGHYLHSFYLPDFNGRKVQRLKVIDSTIVAIYDDWILTYRLKD